MSQNPIPLPTTGTISGMQLVSLINSSFDTLLTLNSGSSAPTNPAEAYMLWMDTSTAPPTLRINDGNGGWTALGTIDGTNHVWTPIHGSGLSNMLAIASSQNWVVPSGVNRVLVELWGGGGGGGGGNASVLIRGAGGAAGGFARGFYAVTPGATFAATVGGGGGGGAGGNPSAPGAAGGTSSFGSLLSATGGNGASGIASGAIAGPIGGAGVGGQLNLNGGAGMASMAVGNTGTNPYSLGGSSPQGGFGGASNVGDTGTFPGGGGAGGNHTNGNGGAGAPGLVLVRW